MRIILIFVIVAVMEWFIRKLKERKEADEKLPKKKKKFEQLQNCLSITKSANSVIMYNLVSNDINLKNKKEKSCVQHRLSNIFQRI